MTKKRPKDQCERIHFKSRLRSRYGLTINRGDYWNIVDAIKCGNAQLLLEQSNTRKVYRVDFALNEQHRVRRGVEVINGTVSLVVVYDKKRGEAVTALPQSITTEQIVAYMGDYNQL